MRDSVKQIDKTSWLVGSKYVLCYVQAPREEDGLWENTSDGSYYIYPLCGAGPLARCRPTRPR